MKLATHLTPQYINSVLSVGGRYVCGNPDSLMPVWAASGGGPLNYLQIEDVIAFLRATNDVTYQRPRPGNERAGREQRQGRDVHRLARPELRAARDGHAGPGLLEPAGQPDAGASGSRARAVRPLPAARAAPSGATGGLVINEVAVSINFQTTSLEAPADKPFQIAFDNQDPAIPTTSRSPTRRASSCSRATRSTARPRSPTTSRRSPRAPTSSAASGTRT